MLLTSFPALARSSLLPASPAISTRSLARCHVRRGVTCRFFFLSSSLPFCCYPHAMSRLLVLPLVCPDTRTASLMIAVLIDPALSFFFLPPRNLLPSSLCVRSLSIMSHVLSDSPLDHACPAGKMLQRCPAKSFACSICSFLLCAVFTSRVLSASLVNTLVYTFNHIINHT